VALRQAETVVVGAGIAGVMTALSLLRRGCSVNLIDRWAPGHGRASSSDYTRLIRSIHGADEFYTRWVREARLRWMELQAELGTTLLVECGALVMAGEGHTAWEDSTLPTFDKLGVPYHRFSVDELRVRFPQFNYPDVAYGIYEPEAGALMAKRAVVQTAELFRREGGTITRGRVTTDERERLLLDGKPLEADMIAVTTGPWLGEMYRRTVAPIAKIVRQNIIYTSTPDGNPDYDSERMPCWIDHGYGAYGAPSVEGSGVKAAIAWTEAIIDLDNDERVVDEATFNRTRQYLNHRLKGLVGQRAVDQKACQIAMTPDTHFILDFHPEHDNVLLVGGCSGHLFKHGPVFGDFVAGVGLREYGTPDRFKLGSRGKLSAGASPSGR
jgi:glycine/D-amino acid oxidase-like deaminating enzyme